MKRHHHLRILKLVGLIRECVDARLEELEELFERWEHLKRHRAHHLLLTFKWRGISIQGEHLMISEPLTVGFSVQASGSPVQADGTTPSAATLSNVVFASSDPTIFTVAPDPTVAGGGIVAAIGAGSATLTMTALATEPDGTTTETITGSATVVVTPVIPTPGIAAALVLSFGAPFPTPPPNPPTV